METEAETEGKTCAGDKGGRRVARSEDPVILQATLASSLASNPLLRVRVPVFPSITKTDGRLSRAAAQPLLPDLLANEGFRCCSECLVNLFSVCSDEEARRLPLLLVRCLPPSLAPHPLPCIPLDLLLLD